MTAPKLIVSLRARFDWLEPPKDTPERMMREMADAMADRAAHDLTAAVQLLVLELLNAKTPNVRVKPAPTVWRAGPVGENVPRTADRARVTRRWGSA